MSKDTGKTQDPFEEFEFKPLTEGLGFHRKPNKAVNAEPNSLLNDKIFKSKGMDLLDESEPTPLQPPLPRKSLKIEDSKLTPSSAAVDEILRTLSKNKAAEVEVKTAPAKKQVAAPIEAELVPTPFSFTAFILDSLLIIASSLICMILLLAITKVDLISNLSNPDEEGMIYLATLSVILGVSFVFYIVNRAFIGCTPGEWAYDHRIGLPEDMKKISYTPKVILRWLLIVGTGLIPIPLASKIFGKDLAGEWTKTPLMKKN